MRNKLLAFYKEGVIEVGTDEAGRGCLAGPVFAAAVILPPDYYNSEINDSKLLSEKKRFKLRDLILSDALDYSIASVDNVEIDKINILNASIKAMHIAIDKLNTVPQHIIVDGNRFKPFKNISHNCIVKGDSKYSSIAAASILAKTFRDEYMSEQHNSYQCYNWIKNKGYPTEEHRKAIINNGICYLHRKTFISNILSSQLKIF